jgi:hypothetical protein
MPLSSAFNRLLGRKPEPRPHKEATVRRLIEQGAEWVLAADP